MLKEGATIIVPWEKYQKRKVHTLKGKLALIDYKRSLIDYKSHTMFTKRLQKTTKSQTWTTKFTDRLQKITKVPLRLQSLLQKTPIDYKKSDIHYKVY